MFDYLWTTIDSLRKCIISGASLDLRDSSRGLTAIEWAELCGRQDCVEAIRILQLVVNSPQDSNKSPRCNPFRSSQLGSRCGCTHTVETLEVDDGGGILERMKLLLHQCVKPPTVMRCNSMSRLPKRRNRRIMSRCQSEGVLNSGSMEDSPRFGSDKQHVIGLPSFTDNVPDIYIQHVNAKDDPIATRYGDPVSPFQRRKCEKGQVSMCFGSTLSTENHSLLVAGSFLAVICNFTF